LQIQPHSASNHSHAGVRRQLPALRNRATQLLGVSALAASFLGLAHPATGQAFGVWGWFAIAAFVVTKALTP
jgi:hypothetical protein